MDIKLFSNIKDSFRYDPVLDKDPLFYTATQEGMPFLMDSALSGDERQTARLLPNFQIDNIANPLNWGKTPTTFKTNDEFLTAQQYTENVSGALASLVTTPEQTAFIRNILNPATNPYRTMEFPPEKFNRQYLSSLQAELTVLRANPESEENNKKIAEKIHEFSTISSQLQISEAELAAIKQDDALRTSIILDASDGWGTETAGWIIEDLPWVGTGYDGEAGKDIFTKDRSDIEKILNQEDPNFDGIQWFRDTFKDETVRAGLAQYGLTETTFAAIKNINKAKVITANALMNTEMQRKMGQYQANLSGFQTFQNGVLNLGYSIFNSPDTVELAVDTVALSIASAGMKLIGAGLTATGVGAGVGVPTLAGSVAVDAATAARAVTLASRVKKILGYSLEAAPKFILNDVPSFGKAWGLGARTAWMVGGGATYGAAASLSTQRQNIAISELTNFTSPGAQRELSYSQIAFEAAAGGVFTGVLSAGLTLSGAGLNKFINENWFQESRKTVGRTVDFWKNKGIKNPQVVSEAMPPVERAVAAAAEEGRDPTPADVVEEVAATNRTATAREIGSSSTAADSAPTNPAINQAPAESLEQVVERAVRSNSLKTYQDAQRLAMAQTGETDFSKLTPKEQAEVLVNTQRVLFLTEREAIKQGGGSIDPAVAKYLDNSRKQLKANVAGVRKNFTPEQRKLFESTLKAAVKSEKRFRYALKKNKIFGELFEKLAIEIPAIKPGKKFKELTKLLTVPEVAQAIRVGNVKLGITAIRDTLYTLASVVDGIENRIEVLNQKRLAVAEKYAASPELAARLEVIDDELAKASVELSQATSKLDSNSLAAKQLLVELEAREPEMTAAIVDKARETSARIREALDSAETKGPEQAKEDLREAISEVVPAKDVDEVAETVLASRILDGEKETDTILAEIVGTKPNSIIGKLKRSMNAARANFNKATRDAKREIYTGDNTKEIFVKHAVSFWGAKAEKTANALHDRFSIFVKAGMLTDKEFRFFLAVMLDMPLNSERLGLLSTRIKELQKNILGEYNPNTNSITISTNNKLEVLNTVLHEFGHALEGTNFLTQKLISKAYNDTSLDSIVASINEIRKALGIKRLATEYSVSDKHEAFAELFSMFMLIENKTQLDYIEQTLDRSITSLLVKVANQAYTLISNTVRDLGIEAVSVTYSKTIADVIKTVSKNTNSRLENEFTITFSFIEFLKDNAEKQLETTEQLVSDFIETKFRASRPQAKKLAILASKIIDEVNGIGFFDESGELDASYSYAILTTIEELKNKKFTEEDFTSKFVENFHLYNKVETKQVNRFIANQMKIVDAVLTSKNITAGAKKKVITTLETLFKTFDNENALYDYIQNNETLFGNGSFSDEVANILRDITKRDSELWKISGAISSAVTASQYIKGHILQVDVRSSSLASRAKLRYGLQKELNKRIARADTRKFAGVADIGLFNELSYAEQQKVLGTLEGNIDNGLTVDHVLDFLGATGKERDALKTQLKTPEEALVYLSDRSDIDFEKEIVRLFFGEADEKTIEIAKAVSVQPRIVSQADIDEISDLVDEFGPGFFESKAAPEPVEGVPTQAQLQEPNYQGLVMGVESKLKRGLIFAVIGKKDANTADEIKQNVLMDLLTQQKKTGVKSELQDYILSLVAKTDLTEEQKIDLAFNAIKSKLKSFAREEIRKEKKAQLGGAVKNKDEIIDRERAIVDTSERRTAQQRVDQTAQLKYVWEPVRSEDEMFNSDVFNTILNAELNGVKFFELFPEFSLTRGMTPSEKEIFAKLNDRDTLVAIATKKLKEGLTDGKENPTVKDYVTLVFGETDPAKVATLERKIKSVKKKAKNQIQAAVEVWERVSDGNQLLQNAVDIELSSRNTKPLVVKEQAVVVESLTVPEPKPAPAVAPKPTTGVAEIPPATLAAVPDESTIPMPYKVTDNVTEETLHVVGSWDGSGEVPIGSVLVTRIDGGISRNTKPGSNVVSVNVKTETPLTLRYNTKNGTLSVVGEMKNKKKFLSSIGIEKNVKHMLLANIQSTYESLVNNIEKINGLGYDAVRIVDETGRVRAIMLTKAQKPEVVRVFKIEEPVAVVPTPKPEAPAMKPKVEPAPVPAPELVAPIKDISEAVTVVHQRVPKATPLDPGVPKTPIRVPEEKPVIEVVETKAVNSLPPEEELATVVRDKVGNRARGVDPEEIIKLVKEAGKLFKAAKTKLGYALSEADFMTVRNRMIDMYVQVNEYITNMNETLFGADFKKANDLFWTKVDNIIAEQKLKAADTNTELLINTRAVYKQAAAEVSKAFKKEFVAPMTFSEFKARKISVVKTETGNSVEFTFDVSKERQGILDAVNNEKGVPDPSEIPEPAPQPAPERPSTAAPTEVPEAATIPVVGAPEKPTPLREALKEKVREESNSHLARENFSIIAWLFGGSERATANWYRRLINKTTGLTQLSSGLANTIRSFSAVVRHVSRFADNTRLQTGTFVAPGQEAGITWREAHSYAINAMHGVIQTVSSLRSYVQSVGPENMAKLEQVLAINRFAGRPVTAADVVTAVPDIARFAAHGRRLSKGMVNPEKVAELLNNVNLEQTKAYKRLLDLQVETGNLQIIDDLGVAVNPENYFPILFDADKLAKNRDIRPQLLAALMKARVRTKLASPLLDTNTMVAMGWLELEVVAGTVLTKDRKILGIMAATDRFDAETLSRLNPRKTMKSSMADPDRFKQDLSRNGFMYSETSDSIIQYELPKTVEQLSDADRAKYYATINGSTEHYADTELVRNLFGRRSVVEVEMNNLIDFKTFDGDYRDFGKPTLGPRSRPTLSATTRDGNFLLDVRNISPDEIMSEPLIASFVKTNPVEVTNLFFKGRMFELIVQKELLKKYGIKGLTMKTYLEQMESIALDDLEEMARTNPQVAAKRDALRDSITNGFTRLYEEYASYTGSLRTLDSQADIGKLTKIAQDIIRFKTSWNFGLAAMAVEAVAETARIGPIKAIPEILRGISYLIGPKRFKMDALLKSEVGDMAFIIDDLQTDLGNRYLSDVYDGPLSTDSPLSKIIQRNEKNRASLTGTAANFATEVGSLSAVDRFNRSLGKVRITRQYVEDLRAGRLTKLLAALQDPAVAADLQRLFNLSGESPKEAKKLIKRWKGVARQAGFPYDPTRAAVYNQYGLLEPDFVKAMKYLIDKSNSADGRINFITFEKIAFAAADDAPVSRDKLFSALDRFRYYTEDMLTKQTASRQAGLNRALGVGSRTWYGKLTETLTGWLRSFQDNVIMDYTNRNPMKYLADTILLAGGLGMIYSYLREILAGRDVSDVIEEIKDNPEAAAIRSVKEMNLLGVGNALLEIPLSATSEMVGGTWKKYGGLSTTPGLDVLSSLGSDVNKVVTGVTDVLEGNTARGTAKMVAPLIAPPVNKGFTAIPVKGMEMMLNLERTNQLQIFLDSLRTSKKAPYTRGGTVVAPAPLKAPTVKPKTFYDRKEQYEKSRVTTPKLDINSQFNIKGVSSNLADLLGKPKGT